MTIQAILRCRTFAAMLPEGSRRRLFVIQPYLRLRSGKKDDARWVSAATALGRGMIVPPASPDDVMPLTSEASYSVAVAGRDDRHVAG